MPATARLRLDLVLPRPDQEAPDIVLRTVAGECLDRISITEPAPSLPLAPASAATVHALDVLEHVRDEQAWLAELARVVAPGGALVVRVPLQNMLAWTDALNIYRYLSDTIGYLTPPAATHPVGWHRRYRPHEAAALVEQSGFDVLSITSRGIPVDEAPRLLRLIAGNLGASSANTGQDQPCAGQVVRERDRIRMPARFAASITIHARNRPLANHDHDTS